MTAGPRPAPAGATEALYAAQHERVHALCYAMLHDRGDAEDAVQETFARMAQRIDRLDGDPAAYVMVVARNVCRDELRRRLRHRTDLNFTTARPERAPEDTAVDRGLLRLVWRRLEAAERRLFAHTFSGLSLGEIAEQSGVSIDCAAQRMSRARRHARRLIGAPVALLVPLLNGEAVSRMLRRLASARDLVGTQFLRSDPGAQVIWPLLLGIATAGVGPASLGAAAAPPPVATAIEPAAPVASTTGAAPALRLAPAVAAVHRAASSVRAATPPPLPPGVPPDPRATFSSFTPSPDYASDHTVFAASSTYCTNGCASLWRSQDAGHTWQALSRAFLDTFRVLLPPAYPADPTIYALSSTVGLERSSDGGKTFVPVAPMTQGMAAVDPTSPEGDARILLVQQGGSQLALYSERSNSVVPLSTLPTDVYHVYSVFTGPGASAVYVDAARLSGTFLYACTGAEPCRQIAGATPTSVTPVVSPTFATDRTYFTALTNPNGVVVATLDGATRTIDLGDRTPVAVLPAADYATSHRLDIITQVQTSSGGGALSTLRAVIGAVTAPVASAVNELMNFPSMTRLPDGRLVVGIALNSGPVTRSLLCSVDDGATWAATC